MLAALLCAALCLGQETAPSVLLIVIDDVGPTEQALVPSLFGANGLASKGVSFTRCTSWPVCSPSRYAMLTGRYPRREGIGDLQMASMLEPGPTTKRIALERNTIAKVFAPTYATGYVGKWHLGRPALDVGLSSNFTTFEQAKIQASLGPFLAGFEWARQVNPDVPNAGLQSTGYFGWWSGVDGLLFLSHTYATDAQRDAFVAWWSTTAGPRMAWLSWSAAHYPYDVPPGGTAQATTRLAFEQVVANLDLAMSAVLAQVDLATTFVFVVSDNGTPDDARPAETPTGYWKFTTFEGGVRVPLIVAGPGISSGVVSTRAVSLVDIPATMTELAGLALSPGFDDSRSFANEFGSKWTGTSPRDFTFAERYGADYDDQMIVEQETMIGQIQVRLKLRRIDADGPAGPVASQDLVYDLLDDPTEHESAALSTLPPQIRNRLLAELASVPARQ